MKAVFFPENINKNSPGQDSPEEENRPPRYIEVDDPASEEALKAISGVDGHDELSDYWYHGSSQIAPEELRRAQGTQHPLGGAAVEGSSQADNQ